MWAMVATVAAVALVATYLTWTAGRVDRLHTRAASATRALDAHLLRRAAAAAVLAEESAAPDLYAAARAALDAAPEDREAAENDLTNRLRAAPLDAGDGTAESVIAASRRVAVARQVHTDLVRDALGARRRPLVRMLRLAQGHPCPAYFDIGDPTLEPARPGALPAGAVAPRAAGSVGSRSAGSIAPRAADTVVARAAGGPAEERSGAPVLPAVSGATEQSTGA